MTLGPLFIGAKARCRQHPGTVLEIDEDMCLECRIIERNLSMKPPFEAYCIDAGWGFIKGETYSVFWVLRDVINEFGHQKSGYVFKDASFHINDHIMPPDDFIPKLYLTEKNEDEWRVGPETEWVQDESKDKEFQQIADAISEAVGLNEQGLENVG